VLLCLVDFRRVRASRVITHYFIKYYFTLVNRKIMPSVRKAKPLWAQRIAALRSRLGESQARFAQRFAVTPMAVSHWEKGDNRPAAEIFVQLGRMAGDPDCWLFWQEVGLTKTDVARSVPDLEARLYTRSPLRIEMIPARGATQHGDALKLKKKPDAVGVPLLRDAAAAGSPRMIDQAEVEETLAIPRLWCPHPDHTTCIRVSGRSMYPVLDDGYVVAVDAFMSDPAQLIERMVAARDPDGAITVKWLRKVADEFMLLPQHTSPEYPPVLISRDPGWKIVGEVIWWIGRPK